MTHEVVSTPATGILELWRTAVAPSGIERALVRSAILLQPSSAAGLYNAWAPFAERTRGYTDSLAVTASSLAKDVRPGLASAAALATAVSRLRPRDHVTTAGDRSSREVRDEKQILESGDATVLERARLLGRLAIALSLDARVCLLGDTLTGRLHAVTEIGIMGRWTVFDPVAGRFFLYPHRGYASTHDIMLRPAIVDGHPDHGRLPTLDSTLYRGAAVAALPAAN